MKKVIVIVCFIINVVVIAQVDTTFSGLRGYEDLEGNTQLFYRMKSDWIEPRNEFEYIGEFRNSIFHYDINNNIDSLFLFDGVNTYTPFPSDGQVVTDFEFIDITLTDLYQCGDSYTSFEPGPTVVYNRNYDHPFGVESFHGTTYNLEISKLDTNINVYVYANGSPKGVFTKSEYFAFNFIESTENFKLVSINSISQNIWFVEDDYGFLYKSIDTGKTFVIVDSSIVDKYNYDFYETVDYLNRYFFYDSDSIHIYRIIKDEGKYQLSVSNNKGILNSWERRFESPSELLISIDYSVSGNIYLATDKQIFKSDDYGETFTLYKELDNKIVGIYKKPNSNLVYVTTPYLLLEVNPDTIEVLKQLLNYNASIYNPLHIGDKWYYDVKRIDYDEDFYPNERNYQCIREVIKDTLVDGKKYFELRDTYGNSDSISYIFLRNDLYEGKVYQYAERADSTEFIKEELNIDRDEFFNSWIDYNDNPFEVEVYLTDIFNYKMFETNTISKITKKYEFNGPFISEYYLSKDIGKSFQYKGIVDGFDEYQILEAAYINGKIYGDTTLVGVKNNKNVLPSKYSLSQNYPNPFNPSTTIKYSIPIIETGHSQTVLLKVYDILGREVEALVNKEQKPGNYQVTFDASNLSSGIYYYRLSVGNFAKTMKFVLLK